MEAFRRLAYGSSVEQFARDVYLKSNITTLVNCAMKGLHREKLNVSGTDAVTRIVTESGNSVVDLCNCLEALLLHGLKEKLSLSRMATAFRSNSTNLNANRLEDHDFWSIILILCHNQVSESIRKLRNINSDIGRCRAWLRLALNEGLFNSYLEALINDTSLLHGFYGSSAYIRDSEHMDLLRGLLEGLDVHVFQLNYDCPSLNSWTVETLKLIGCSSIQNIPDPVMPAEEADESFGNSKSKRKANQSTNLRRDRSEVVDSTGEQLDLSSSSKTEEEDLHQESSIGEEEERSNESSSDEAEFSSDAQPVSNVEVQRVRDEDTASIGGNSLNRKYGWSSSPPLPPEDSYDSILQSYSTQVVLSSTPDISDIAFGEASIQKIEDVTRRRSFSLFTRKSTPNVWEPLITTDFDFEVIPKSVVINNAEPDTQRFLLQFTKLANEMGLDEQDYKCHSCARPVGLIYGKSRICAFDGYHYCLECHKNDESLIPARIINNWDFRKYTVCRKNLSFLQLTESEPLIDIKLTAPLIYKVIPEMTEALNQRTQLFYLHAFLFTCEELVALELRKKVWPREHLFEHIHLYSCVDLVQVQSGQLSQILKKAIQSARKHVLGCLLCSQKGFICEICKSSQIIYPFDTNVTHRCETCKAVFHTRCVIMDVGIKPCPRCIRIQRRERSVTAI